MEQKNKEQIYDEEIAPILLNAAKLCKKHGFNMVCMTDWGGDDYGETTAISHDAPYTFRVAQYWARSRGNFDIFFPNVLRLMGDRIQESIFLRGFNKMWEEWK